ncbi:MAG: hypothetical protein KJ623_03225 [Nanoarchaeota archaeon]|nr:hypothetical protein [Nanoarchaeota archaeon]
MTFYKEYENGMKPKYRAGVLGAPLSIQSANQIQDMGLRLNEGMRNIEVSAISPEIAEGIPEEHFNEMRRLAELTDSKVSLHAPIIDASGFTQQGWSENNRVMAEKQFDSIVSRAHNLDKDGNVPIVIHGANMFGAEFDKSIETEYKEELKKEFEALGQKMPEKMPRVMTAVDQITGQIVPLEFKKKYKLGAEEEEIWSPQKQLYSLNQTHWDQEKLKIFSQMKDLMELESRKKIIEKNMEPLALLENKDLLHKEERHELEKLNHDYNTIQGHTSTINEHITSSVHDMYNTYVRCHPNGINPEEKEVLDKIGKDINDIDKNDHEAKIKIHNLFLDKNISEEEKKRKIKELSKNLQEAMNEKTKLVGEATIRMQHAPELFIPVNEFSKENASKTFANVAFNAFKEFGEKAPIIAVENSYPNMPLSTGKDLKEAIELSRKKFAELLVNKKDIDPKKANEIAKKLIGATWDVGHINQLRKSGYSEEDIIKEAKEIAPYVKHVHLTDNFGFADTHLPPGMGNVPIKETLEILEKRGDMEGVRQIIEAGNFVQNFKESPYPYALEALGSPIYSMGGAPYWNEIQTRSSQASYMTGFGDMLPDYHFKQFYGGGWAAVPRELGGEAKGGSDKGRFAEGQ